MPARSSWLLWMGIALPAYAHLAGVESKGGFLVGFLHPLSGIDHVVAMVAVGLWGSQLGMPAIYVLPITFPIVMAMGGFLGLIGVPVPGVEVGIALSAAALGLAVAMRVKVSLGIAAGLVACFALFHGYAHGTELPGGFDAERFSLGFVLATGLLHACGIAIGMLHCWRAGGVIIRVLGALICCVGLSFLSGALR
jgi:urease accessory protein